MKIINIIARLNVGGPPRHIIWLTKELQDEEFQSMLVAGTVPEGEEDMGYLASDNGIEPVFIAEMSRELSLRDSISLYKVYRCILREKPDIIHTHTAKAGTVGRLAGLLYRWLTWKTLIGRPRKILILHTFHGHVFHSYYGKLKTGVFIAIEKFLALFATDRIIVISPQQLNEINGGVGIGKREQFEVIPLGIDLDAFADGAENRKRLHDEIGAADGELLIGFVGRLTEIKNVSLFLNVAALCGKGPDTFPRLRFVIVGDGNMRRKLEAEVQALGIDRNVSFLGNRVDAEAIYAGFDVVALTSFNEGTPMSLIEAMASKRPVISTAVGGVVDLLGEPETAQDGFKVCERGISVAGQSAESFYNGLIFLVKNEELRGRLGAAGYEFVKNNYSKERLVTDIKSLYRKLIK